MDNNVNVKEILKTAAICLILNLLFTYVVGKNFTLTPYSADGNSFSLFKAIIISLPIFLLYYAIFLFTLKNKNNLQGSLKIIFILLLLFFISDIFKTYELGSTMIKNHLPIFNSMPTFILKSNSYWILNIVALTMIFLKYLKENNLSNENNENVPEKNLIIGLGMMGVGIYALIFGLLDGNYLFFGVAVISSIIISKKKFF